MTTMEPQDQTAPLSRRRTTLRWIERALLLIGILCLGTYAYALLESRVYEYWENRKLEDLAAQQSAGQPVVPVQETRALAQFHQEDGEAGGAGRPRLDIPAPEAGELIGRIEIPNVGVSAIVQEGVASRTLRRGAGRIPGTSLPWEPGNIGIAAHRDRFFRGLKDIQKDDLITLTTVHGTYRYKVESTEVVTPRDTHVLQDTGDDVLTLVTCYPFYYVGSAPKRFIVRAHRIEGGAAGTAGDGAS
jgi:sortase A